MPHFLDKKTAKKLSSLDSKIFDLSYSIFKFDIFNSKFRYSNEFIQAYKLYGSWLSDEMVRSNQCVNAYKRDKKSS